MSYSQIGQDTYYINNIINHRKGGFFLDIGANDGIYTSNTAKLELEYNWQGICIEANESLIPSLIKNRPNSTVVHSAAWHENTNLIFEIPLVSINGVDGHLLSRIANLNLNVGAWTEHFSQPTKVVTVPARTVTDILISLNRYPCEIDYMSLDVEGAELDVLKGIDFSHIKIKFMTIEHGDRKNYLNDIVEYLTLYGYKCHRVNKWDVEFIW